MAALRQSPSMTARCSCSHRGHVEAVDEADGAGAGHRQQGGAEGVEVADVEAVPVDGADGAGDDRRPAGGPEHEREERLA